MVSHKQGPPLILCERDAEMRVHRPIMGSAILGEKLTHSLYCKVDILDEGQMEDTAETQKVLALSRAKERQVSRKGKSESDLDQVEKEQSTSLPGREVSCGHQQNTRTETNVSQWTITNPHPKRKTY